MCFPQAAAYVSVPSPAKYWIVKSGFQDLERKSIEFGQNVHKVWKNMEISSWVFDSLKFGIVYFAAKRCRRQKAW